MNDRARANDTICKKITHAALHVIRGSKRACSSYKTYMPAVRREFQIQELISFSRGTNVIENLRRKEGIVNGAQQQSVDADTM